MPKIQWLNAKFYVLPFTDHFNIYTREAGAGHLSCAIEGPSTPKMFLEQRPNGFLGLSYKVEKPGTSCLIYCLVNCW